MRNNIIKLTERDLESIIEKVISEQLTTSQTNLKKLQKTTGKENKDYHKSVAKKMADVVKSNNQSEVIEGKDTIKVNADQGLGEEKEGVIQDYNYGMTDLRYENEPSKRFKERAEKAIVGDSTMGNGPSEQTEMNDDVKDKQLGEKIVAAAKAKFKAEQENPYSNTISMGSDIETAKGASRVRQLAFESMVKHIKEELLEEGIELSNDDISASLKEEIDGFGYGFKQETEVNQPEGGPGEAVVGDPRQIAQAILNASSGDETGFAGTKDTLFVESILQIDSPTTLGKVNDELSVSGSEEIPKCCEDSTDIVGCFVYTELGHHSNTEFTAIANHNLDNSIGINLTDHPKCKGFFKQITTLEEEDDNSITEIEKAQNMAEARALKEKELKVNVGLNETVDRIKDIMLFESGPDTSELKASASKYGKIMKKFVKEEETVDEDEVELEEGSYKDHGKPSPKSNEPFTIASVPKDTKQGKFNSDLEKASGTVTITDEYQATTNLKEFNEKTKKESIGEKMYKRLKYSKEFESDEQALSLIPEHHKVDGNMFQLTDNNSYITVRWEGDKKTGEGVVLLHKNKGKMNENIKRMKLLMGYTFGDTVNEQYSQAGAGYGFKQEQQAGDPLAKGDDVYTVSADRQDPLKPKGEHRTRPIDTNDPATVGGFEIPIYRGEVRTGEQATPGDSVVSFKVGDLIATFYASGSLKTNKHDLKNALYALGSFDSNRVAVGSSDLLEKLRAVQGNVEDIDKWIIG